LLHQILDGLVAQSAGDSGLVQFLPLVLVSAIVYFLLLRPQQKQAKEQQTLLASLKKGDEVVTQGGMLGRIHAVTDKVVTLEIAKDVRIKVIKSFVQARASAETTDADTSKKDAPAEEKKEGK
jgi:preprotein translocase subunit YajC